jgi:hypothetical protein
MFYTPPRPQIQVHVDLSTRMKVRGHSNIAIVRIAGKFIAFMMRLSVGRHGRINQKVARH